MSRIVQGMSLINHFLGSVLASADIEASRRSANTNRTTTPSTRSTTNSAGSQSSPSLVRLPSYLFPRGMTEAIRTNAPTAVRTAIPPSTTIPSPHGAIRKAEKSSLSNSCTIGESSEAASSSNADYLLSDQNSSKKRKLEEDEEDKAEKKPKNEKGKEKNKKD